MPSKRSLKLSIPLTSEEKAKWDRRLERARQLRTERLKGWREAVQKYMGKALEQTPDHDLVVVNKEFSFLE